MFNIWDQLLGVIINVIVNTVFNFLPTGSDSSDLANAVQFVQGMTAGTVIVIQFTAATLDAFNWQIPLAAFSWGLLMLAISFAVSVIEYIKSLIEIVTDVIAIIAKFVI